jgi:hypothetical protein
MLRTPSGVLSNSSYVETLDARHIGATLSPVLTIALLGSAPFRANA